MALPVISLKGSAYQQGLNHGRHLRDRIAYNLKVYFHRFEHGSGLPREEVLRRAAVFGPAIARQNPDYYTGMEGIAQGSSFPLDEIIALNVRYEIIYYQSMVQAVAGGKRPEMVTARDGCTAFAAAPHRTANGHLLMGQNWDWVPQVLGAVLHTQHDDGLESLAFTEAGIFGGKIGLNTSGIGLAVNGITSTADDWSRLYKPFHVRCYEILRQKTFQSAVEVVTGSGRACSSNFLIAQPPDQVMDIEAAPEAEYCIGWQDGFLVHTNHFVNPNEIGVEEPPYDKRSSSGDRLERMDKKLREEGVVSVESIQEFLKDHTGNPRAICRHEDSNDPVADQFRTVTSVVMDLDERVMHISDGQPCLNDYQTLVL